MNFKNIFKSFKNSNMRRRILIILGIIIAYRIIAHIPVPLGDAATFQEAIRNAIGSTDFGGFLNLISGGGLAAFSIILVGLSPFITASIITQLLAKAVPKLEELHRDGESGRRKINQWTRIMTVPLAIMQSVAYIFILYQQVASGSAVFIEPTTADWVLSITAMSAASILLMWMGELITEQGVGNGISMVIFASIIAGLPQTLTGLGQSLFNTENGSLSLFGWFHLPVDPTVFFILLCFGIAIIVVLYFLVKINEAQRIITINYAKRVHGNSSYGGIKSVLPIKLIAAGVIPVIFAVAFLSLPAFIGQVMQSADPGNQVATNLTNWFSAPSQNAFAPGGYYANGITWEWFLYPALYFLLVVAFTYFYTSIIFNTKEISENLQKQGGFIEGVRPGAKTAEYLGRTVTRLNLFGALALGSIAMLPFITDYIFIVITGAPIGLSLSGTGLLIVVTVALENLRQLNSRALMVTYDEYQ
jgi:preprotein translocase subunit SecY